MTVSAEDMLEVVVDTLDIGALKGEVDRSYYNFFGRLLFELQERPDSIPEYLEKIKIANAAERVRHL